MTIISYAQNFEDIMLWRALKHIENGFYIDVGAWSPDVDSVTRAFYERGWRGINVEPNPKFHAELVARRTRDINLRMAVSDRVGSLMMNFLSNSGLSTLEETIALNHTLAGWTIDKQVVQVTTLADLWRRHVPEGQVVHFLKVDVEGSEGVALKGNDWSKYRPWIVVVEATRPMTQQESHNEWEPLLLAAGYVFVYADGLNRFYVAGEHIELLPLFKYPPNIFDEFKLDAQHMAEVRSQELQNKVDRLNQEIQVLYASRSWRITRPLRVVFISLLHARSIFSEVLRPVKCSVGGQLGSLIVYMIRFARAHPRFKEWGLHWLRKYPEIDSRLHRFALARGLLPYSASANNLSDMFYMPSLELKRLTPNARCIYTDLKNAIEDHNKGGH